MKFESTRIALETFIRPLWEGKYPDFLMITEESEPIDLTEQILPFMMSSVTYRGDSAQLTMNGSDPRTRFPGRAVFQVLVKEFTGKKQMNECLDFLSNTLAYMQVGDMLLKQPVPLPSETALGWHKGVLYVPFQVDTVRQPT